MLKKLKYNVEKIIYDLKYKQMFNEKFDYKKYKIKNTSFNKKNLNILYLSFDKGSFTNLNVLPPLKKYGNLYIYDFQTNPFDKQWYKGKKLEENKKMLNFVKKIVSENNIDVIVCYLSGHTTTPEILNEIKKLNIPMINTAADDERKFVSRKGKDGLRRGVKDICKYFDLSVTTSRSAVIKYLVEGANPLYSYLGVNNEIYKKLDIEKNSLRLKVYEILKKLKIYDEKKRELICEIIEFRNRKVHGNKKQNSHCKEFIEKVSQKKLIEFYRVCYLILDNIKSN